MGDLWRGVYIVQSVEGRTQNHEITQVLRSSEYGLAQWALAGLSVEKGRG